MGYSIRSWREPANYFVFYLFNFCTKRLRSTAFDKTIYTLLLILESSSVAVSSQLQLSVPVFRRIKLLVFDFECFVDYRAKRFGKEQWVDGAFKPGFWDIFTKNLHFWNNTEVIQFLKNLSGLYWSFILNCSKKFSFYPWRYCCLSVRPANLCVIEI